MVFEEVMLTNEYLQREVTRARSVGLILVPAQRLVTRYRVSP